MPWLLIARLIVLPALTMFLIAFGQRSELLKNQATALTFKLLSAIPILCQIAIIANEEKVALPIVSMILTVVCGWAGVVFANDLYLHEEAAPLEISSD